MNPKETHVPQRNEIDDAMLDEFEALVDKLLDLTEGMKAVVVVGAMIEVIGEAASYMDAAGMARAAELLRKCAEDLPAHAEVIRREREAADAGALAPSTEARH